MFTLIYSDVTQHVPILISTVEAIDFGVDRRRYRRRGAPGELPSQDVTEADREGISRGVAEKLAGRVIAASNEMIHIWFYARPKCAGWARDPTVLGRTCRRLAARPAHREPGNEAARAASDSPAAELGN